MADLPDVLVRGERSRLFPVLADTSKEGRTLSIFLSCLETVPELGRSLLASIDVGVGSRAQIETYTEVVLKKNATQKSYRPDGLIRVTNGSKSWTALVEAKVGNAELTLDQLETYLDLARQNGIDALVTLSNQFASLPSHHPVNVGASARKKVELFHWSWMYVLTQSTLLLSQEDVTDREQRVVLREMNRFLLHQSSGVKGFDQMPPCWGDAISKVLAGGTIPQNSADARELVSAWHQEVGDLSLVLSRQLETGVKVRIPKAFVMSPNDRQKADQKTLSEQALLHTTLDVPDTAGAINVCADLKKRSILISMRLRAPDDMKTSKARVNWLLRQLQKAEPLNIHIRCFWPGKTPATQHTLAALRTEPEIVNTDRQTQAVLSFEIIMAKDLGAKFSQRKLFLSELEALVPAFYNQAAQHLKAWRARAPKISEAKLGPEVVAPAALREEAELEALAGEA